MGDTSIRANRRVHDRRAPLAGDMERALNVRFRRCLRCARLFSHEMARSASSLIVHIHSSSSATCVELARVRPRHEGALSAVHPSYAVRRPR